MLPISHKPSENTQFLNDYGHSPTCDDPGATNDWGSQGGHLRSNEVEIRFLPITRDRIRMEIARHKWCQTAWLFKLLQMICILTYFGHDLMMAWP